MAQDLVVFSPFRWDQQQSRPHQLMRRLAENRRVFFFEEPVQQEGIEPYLDTAEVLPNLFVCQPFTPEKVGGFHERQLPYLDHLLADLIDTYHLEYWIAWFYTPQAEPLIQDYHPTAVVYDCMAEVHQGLRRQRALQQVEADLLDVTDLVFTDAPGLQQSLRFQHGQVHFLPDGVAREHFAQAVLALEEPPTQATLPHPRIGFYGTLDRRLDLALLAHLAQARPHWQLLVVGPVTHLTDEDNMPREENIHYLGPVRFEDLPNYLAGWDLCIMPLLPEESNERFRPSKLLEMMAAERPIVCSRLAGLPEWLRGAVQFAEGPTEFLAACEQLLQEPSDKRQARVAQMRELVAKATWEQVTHQMQQLLEIVLKRNRQRRRGRVSSATVTSLGGDGPNHGAKAANPPSVLILGASAAGLSAALELGDEALVIERRSAVGGRYRTIEDRGFRFDLASFALCSKDPWVQNLYQQILGENLHWQLPEVWVYSNDRYSRYPVQESLYGFAPEVVQECLMGVMKDVAEPAVATSSEQDKGSLESTMPLNSQTLPFRNRRKEPRNLEDFVLETWGAGIARHFLLPYNEKFWTYPLRELEVGALVGSPATFDLERILAGALKPQPPASECTPCFGYPLAGGLQALMDGFRPRIHCELDSEVTQLVPSRHELNLADGRQYRYQQLLSTLSLPQLLKLAEAEVPSEVMQAAESLRAVSVRRVNLGIGREHLTEKHWIYYPNDTLFHRVLAQGNASPHCNAPGGFGLTCEITYSEARPLKLTDEEVIQRCIQDCIRVGLIHSHDPIWTAGQVDLKDHYPLPDQTRASAVARIRQWLESRDIFTLGCAGEWRHMDCDAALIAGQQAASRLLAIRRAMPQAGHA